MQIVRKMGVYKDDILELGKFIRFFLYGRGGLGVVLRLAQGVLEDFFPKSTHAAAQIACGMSSHWQMTQDTGPVLKTFQFV